MIGFFRQPVYLLFSITGLVLAFFSIYPSFFLLYGSFRSTPVGVPGNFTWANYIHVYSDPETYKLIANTLIFAAGASGLSVFLALTLAYITRYFPYGFRSVSGTIVQIHSPKPTFGCNNFFIQGRMASSRRKWSSQAVFCQQEFPP